LSVSYNAPHSQHLHINVQQSFKLSGVKQDMQFVSDELRNWSTILGLPIYVTCIITMYYVYFIISIRNA